MSSQYLVIMHSTFLANNFILLWDARCLHNIEWALFSYWFYGSTNTYAWNYVTQSFTMKMNESKAWTLAPKDKFWSVIVDLDNSVSKR